MMIGLLLECITKPQMNSLESISLPSYQVLATVNTVFSYFQALLWGPIQRICINVHLVEVNGNST